jgi:hypothetical protein
VEESEDKMEEGVRTRGAKYFDAIEPALTAARGNYPVDFIVARRGDRRQPSDFAPNEEFLQVAISEAKFGKHPLDAIFIWLPEVELERVDCGGEAPPVWVQRKK